MGKRNSKGGSKKNKSKKHREKNTESNAPQKEEEEYEGFYETMSQDDVEEDNGDIHTDSTASGNLSDTSSTDTTDTTNTNTADTNDCCEEIKAEQQEMFNKLKNLTESLAAMTLIRDNVNSLSVDTLTELYFTRQVRPLLDALNILSFAFYNMSNAANNIQINTFGDRAEIRHALKLSYKMNDDVDEIINALGRRLKIFIDLINNMDKNCPPFDSGKDS